MRSLWLVVVCLVSLALAPGASGQAKVDLRPKFEKGQEIRLKMDLSSVSRVTFPGNAVMPEQSQEMGTALTLLLKVKEVDPEKGATADLVFEAVELHAGMGGMALDFDSAQPKEKDDPALGATLRSMVGATMTLQIAPDGSITSVTGGGALANAGAFGLPTPGTGESLFGPIGTSTAWLKLRLR